MAPWVTTRARVRVDDHVRDNRVARELPPGHDRGRADDALAAALGVSPSRAGSLPWWATASLRAASRAGTVPASPPDPAVSAGPGAIHPGRAARPAPATPTRLTPRRRGRGSLPCVVAKQLRELERRQTILFCPDADRGHVDRVLVAGRWDAAAYAVRHRPHESAAQDARDCGELVHRDPKRVLQTPGVSGAQTSSALRSAMCLSMPLAKSPVWPMNPDVGAWLSPSRVHCCWVRR